MDLSRICSESFDSHELLECTANIEPSGDAHDHLDLPLTGSRGDRISPANADSYRGNIVRIDIRTGHHVPCSAHIVLCDPGRIMVSPWFAFTLAIAPRVKGQNGISGTGKTLRIVRESLFFDAAEWTAHYNAG